VRRWARRPLSVNESPWPYHQRDVCSAWVTRPCICCKEGTAMPRHRDTALRMGFNHPLGPLNWVDLTGWDTACPYCAYCTVPLGEKFRPCPLIIKIVAAPPARAENGHGVYRYRRRKSRPGSRSSKAVTYERLSVIVDAVRTTPVGSLSGAVCLAFFRAAQHGAFDTERTVLKRTGLNGATIDDVDFWLCHPDRRTIGQHSAAQHG